MLAASKKYARESIYTLINSRIYRAVGRKRPPIKQEEETKGKFVLLGQFKPANENKKEDAKADPLSELEKAKPAIGSLCALFAAPQSSPEDKKNDEKKEIVKDKDLKKDEILMPTEEKKESVSSEVIPEPTKKSETKEIKEDCEKISKD